MTSALESYCKVGNRRVEGWLIQGAIETICELAAMQSDDGIAGPACEIGVHHGRLFILLQLLSGPTERSLAIDLFEMQAENVDGSGKGSRDQLLRNLRAHGCDLARVDLLAENSLRLTAGRIVELCQGRPRLFSIDGGHTAEATRNDLELAHEAVCDGGLVILDDYFNMSWPAVSEGACAFMLQNNAVLMPVAITANKFFFSRGKEAAAGYRRRLREAHPGAKMSTVFGRDVVSFKTPTLRQRVTAHPRWLNMRDTPLGQALRGLKRLI